jgi:hypothetical protein
MHSLGLVGAGLAAIVAALAVDVAFVVRRACHHIGIPIHRFAVDALLPTVPGLAAALATALLLDRWHAPDTLGAIFAQGSAAGFVFVIGFAIFGIPRSAWKRTPVAAAPVAGA